MLASRLRWLLRLSIVIALVAGIIGAATTLNPTPAQWLTLAALASLAAGLAWIWSRDADTELQRTLGVAVEALDRALQSAVRLRASAEAANQRDRRAVTGPPVAESSARPSPEVATVLDLSARVGAAQDSLSASVQALCAEVAAGRSDVESAQAAESRIFDAHPDALLVVSHTCAVCRANAAARALFSDWRDDIVGAMVWDAFTDPEAVLSALDRARIRGVVQDMEFSLRRQSDKHRTVNLGAVAIASAGAGPMELLVVLRDVEGAREAELDAVRRAERNRALLDASVEPVVLVDTEGRILDANVATLLLVGAPAGGLAGISLSQMFTDPGRFLQNLAHAAAAGQVRDAALVLRRRDGSLRDVLLGVDLRRNAEGGADGLFLNLRDVTDVREAERLRDQKDWVVSGIARLNVVFQVIAEQVEFARSIISEVAQYSGAQVGGFYVREENGDAFRLLASHAYLNRKGAETRFLPGQGVLGQVVVERREVHIGNLPSDYLVVGSGLGEASATDLYAIPLILDGEVKGVLELASITPLGADVLEYLRQAAPIVAVAFEATAARTIAAASLAQARQLASELEAQQEQLRNTNAELEEQTASLVASEQKLQAQQTEIELANAELQQQNELLERQRDETERARKTLVMQAQEVALASKYKSEFLANMSHELRTPLNSLLLLARSLRDNATGNLTADQVESAGVIFDSGSDLLNIINEILDLSKIEAGKMELRLSEVDIRDVARTLVSQFEHMAHAQGLVFRVITEPTVPSSLVTDPQRLGQILKNLIGNALKFTEQGSVSVRFARPSADARFRRAGFDLGQAVAVHVIDTGIGIPENQQKVIFEAFQQADSGDRRRYGGTGLGLSISRELANLLGGEIHVSSEPGKGSTFTLYIPEKLAASDAGDSAPEPVPVVESGREPVPEAAVWGGHAPPAHGASGSPRGLAAAEDRPRPNVEKPQTPLQDDHGRIEPQDRVILLIEDDLRFAKILIEHVRQRGFKCLHATTGESGLELARVYRPHGVVLDIELPAMDGWAVLSELKQDLSLRHIPVHIVSVEPASKTNLGIGAIGHATKPVAHEQIDEVLKKLEAASATAAKRVLVIEDEPLMRAETVRVIGDGNVKVDAVGTGRDGLAHLAAASYDLVVMDLGLPDMHGVDLLQAWAKTTDKLPPVIIHTVRELTMEEELFLRNFSDSIIIKDVRSQERLIDEVALFLHRVVQDLPEDKRQAIFHLRQSDEPLRGKKVLIVEDDMRTMFAMARMLAGHGVHPVKAENGERALAMLAEHPDTDLVLLDMMMPVMDGYEVARRLRQEPAFAQLPVIALTAKAMREDRQRCLEAGCTDYLSKPVDPDRLTSLMRVLLFR